MDALSRRSRGGLRSEWCQRALLDARVHIRLVVVADIQYVVVAVDRSRKRLYSYVCGPAVSREADRVEIRDALCAESRLNAGQHGRCAREG